jgi:hypothetical protein
MENRNGLIVTTKVLQANGTDERVAALVMLEQIPGEHRVTVGADQGLCDRVFTEGKASLGSSSFAERRGPVVPIMASARVGYYSLPHTSIVYPTLLEKSPTFEQGWLGL